MQACFHCFITYEYIYYFLFTTVFKGNISKIEVKYHLCLKTRIIVDIPKILQRPQKVAYVKCLSGVR
jgi:hypothetical protein